MKDKQGTLERQGQLRTENSVNSQLASLLPGCGLEKLTDSETIRLVQFLNFLDSEAAEEGFREGWIAGRACAECDYNGDGLRLLGAGPRTTH